MEVEFLHDGWPARLPLTSEMIGAAEQRLGVRLPRLYLDLLQVQNGGLLKTMRFDGISGSAKVYIHWFKLEGLGDDYGIDNTCGDETYNALLLRNWSFPAASVVFAFQGHGGLAFDYTACGPQGEPSVIYVNDDHPPGEEEHLQLAPTFTAFLAHLSPLPFPVEEAAAGMFGGAVWQIPVDAGALLPGDEGEFLR